MLRSHDPLHHYLILSVTNVMAASSNCTIQTGAAGTSLALTIPYARTGLELKKEARMHGMSLLILEENAATITILLSCSSITTDDFAPACQLLSRLLNK